MNDGDNTLLDRLPNTSEEHDAWVEELYKRLGQARTEVGQLSVTARLNVLSTIRINDSIRSAARQIDESANKLGLGMVDVTDRLKTSVDALTTESGLTREQIGDASGIVHRALGSFEDRLSVSIDAFTKASDEHGKALARWTKWLVIATVILGLATIALVYVEWSKDRKPEPAALATTTEKK